MSEVPQNEGWTFAWKVAGYIGGILLGLGAKLVVVHRNKPLTMKDYIYHGVIAFASAWLVWWALSSAGQLELANLVSVVVGRYGDAILIAAYNKILDFFNSLKPNKNDPDENTIAR